MSDATCPVQGPSGLLRYPYPASKHVVVTSSPCAGFWCHGHTLDLICGFGEDRRWSFKRAVRRKQNDRWREVIGRSRPFAHIAIRTLVDGVAVVSWHRTTLRHSSLRAPCLPWRRRLPVLPARRASIPPLCCASRETVGALRDHRSEAGACQLGRRSEAVGSVLLFEP